jgi:hypothetical protein
VYRRLAEQHLDGYESEEEPSDLTNDDHDDDGGGHDSDEGNTKPRPLKGKRKATAAPPNPRPNKKPSRDKAALPPPSFEADIEDEASAGESPVRMSTAKLNKQKGKEEAEPEASEEEDVSEPMGGQGATSEVEDNTEELVTKKRSVKPTPKAKQAALDAREKTAKAKKVKDDKKAKAKVGEEKLKKVKASPQAVFSFSLPNFAFLSSSAFSLWPPSPFPEKGN